MSHVRALFSLASGRIGSIHPLGQRTAKEGHISKGSHLAAFLHRNSKENSLSSREKKDTAHTVNIQDFFFFRRALKSRDVCAHKAQGLRATDRATLELSLARDKMSALELKSLLSSTAEDGANKKAGLEI